MTLTVGELQAILTLKSDQFDKGLKTAKADWSGLEQTVKGTRLTPVVDAGSAKKVIADVAADVKTLDGAKASPDVVADISKATGDLSKVTSDVKAVDGLKAEVQAVADTSSAQKSLGDLDGVASDAGDKAGGSLGSGIVDGAQSALGKLSGKSGPIVGAVLGALSVIAAIHPGLKIIEAITKDASATRRGALQAATGLDAATAAKWGRAVGESYAQNFGESIDDNMSAARAALQAGLLGKDASQTDITETVNGLQTVADILGEEVPSVARAAGQAIKTGLVKDGTEALDLITKAQQNGVNVADDLLDTVSEYGTQFRKLGLDGQTAFGLVSQAVNAGARDADVAADALKEFSIRAIDGSKTTEAGFDAIGLSSTTMAARIAKGGTSSTKALGDTLKALEAIKDPVKRNAAAVNLFGTQAEDLGDALYAMDLDTAAKGFGKLKGSVDGAMEALSDNSAAKIEKAKRGIETAATGIQDALASAFAPQIEDATDWIGEHRAEITGFLLDIGGAIIDGAGYFATLGSTALHTAAQVIPSIGGMTDSVLAFVQGIIDGVAAIPGADKVVPGLSTAKKNIDGLRQGASDAFHAAAEGAETAATAIDTQVSPAIDAMRKRYDKVAESAQAQAELADATSATTNRLKDLGKQADGSTVSIKNYDGALDTSTKTGSLLDKGIKDVMTSLGEQIDTARDAGESQKELKTRYRESRDALVDQLKKMGLTEDQAKDLVKQYDKVKPKLKTKAELDTTDAQTKADELLRTLTQIHNNPPNYVELPGKGSSGKKDTNFADGGVEDHVAQIAQGGSWRVWAEDETGGEAYIPLAPGKRARSAAILSEVADRFGMALVPEATTSFASGGVLGTSVPASTLKKYADKTATKLELVQMRQRIRDLNKSLAAKEKDGKHKGERELRGLDRKEAELQLKAAKKDLADAQYANTLNSSKAGTIAHQLAALDKAAEKKATAKEKATEAKQAAAEKKSYLADQYADYDTSIRRGEITSSVTSGRSGAQSVVDQMLDLAQDENLTPAQRRAFAAKATSADTALTKLYDDLDAVTSKLDEAQAKADAAQAIVDQVQSGARSDFVSNLTDKSSTPASFLASLNKKIADYTQFGPNLKALAAKGLPKSFLAELVNAGLDGAAAASKLLNAPNLLDIIKSANDLDAVTAQFGDTASELLTGTSASVAQGIVKGLQAQQDEINAGIAAVAQSMVATFKKELGIASPSKVFTKLTEFVGDGAVKGLENSMPAVSAATANLLSVPASLVPSTSTAGTASVASPTVHLTVINPVGEPTVLTVEKALQDVLVGFGG